LNTAGNAILKEEKTHITVHYAMCAVSIMITIVG